MVDAVEELEKESDDPEGDFHTNKRPDKLQSLVKRIRAQHPLVQFFIGLFTLGVVYCLLGLIPFPLFGIFSALGLPMVMTSVTFFAFIGLQYALFQRAKSKR